MAYKHIGFIAFCVFDIYKQGAGNSTCLPNLNDTFFVIPYSSLIVKSNFGFFIYIIGAFPNS